MATKQPKKYTTTEAAKITGIPENTIRSWMSRKPGLFTENLHYTIEESGQKMWTDAGVEFLKTRASTNTEPTQNILEPLLNEAADYYAQRFWEELPARILTRIQQMRTNPTPEEQELMQQSVRTALSIGTFELLPQYIKGLPDGEN